MVRQYGDWLIVDYKPDEVPEEIKSQVAQLFESQMREMNVGEILSSEMVIRQYQENGIEIDGRSTVGVKFKVEVN